ncbi:MAG TPA: MerR family transcriptional regulator [Jiangellaceae bacterium]
MSIFYSPGEVADKFGFSLDTLRYYERIGVLPRIDRAPSGHRRYQASDIEMLDLIRCLRDTGMPIDTLRRFAELVRAGDDTARDRVALLEDHDNQLAAHLELLLERRDRIRHKIDYYRSLGS